MKTLALVIALVAANKRASWAASMPRRWLLQREACAQLRVARAALIRHCLAHPVRAVA